MVRPPPTFVLWCACAVLGATSARAERISAYFGDGCFWARQVSRTRRCPPNPPSNRVRAPPPNLKPEPGHRLNRILAPELCAAPFRFGDPPPSRAAFRSSRRDVAHVRDGARTGRAQPLGLGAHGDRGLRGRQHLIGGVRRDAVLRERERDVRERSLHSARRLLRERERDVRESSFYNATHGSRVGYDRRVVPFARS